MIETVAPSATITQNLTSIESERRNIHRELQPWPLAALWQRPDKGKWSAAENLVHLNRTMTVFVTTLQVITPILYPLAWLNRNRPYELGMTDWMNSPGYRPMQTNAVLKPPPEQISLSEIEVEFTRRLENARHYFLALDEAIAGNLRLPYPPTKSEISVLQLSWTLLYHERLHIRAIHALPPPH